MFDELAAVATTVANEGSPEEKVAFMREAADLYESLGNEAKAKELRRMANLFEALHRSGKL